jgi:hypothetical protein
MALLTDDLGAWVELVDLDLNTLLDMSDESDYDFSNQSDSAHASDSSAQQKAPESSDNGDAEQGSTRRRSRNRQQLEKCRQHSMKSRQRKREEKKRLDRLVVGKTKEAEELQKQIKALQAEAHYLREHMVQAILSTPAAALPVSDQLGHIFRQTLLAMPSPFPNVTSAELCKLQTFSLPSPPVAGLRTQGIPA